ncbi:MAG: glycosyltransferase family 9 protein [Bdellovibrionales bacterium]|nr:glycosyltransferase family 9 protein [Bdellovibrionales bacterium]
MAHLVFQTAFPGDVFLSIPLIKRLRAFDPGTPIVLACRPGLGDFFLLNGLVDEVIAIDKRSRTGRAQARQRLQREEWDLVLVPHSSVRTALWMWGVRARRGRVSFRKWWNAPFFDKRVVRPDHLPDALRQMSLLAPIDNRVAEWFATPEVHDLANPIAQQSLSLRQPLIPDWASMELGYGGPMAENDRTVFLAPGSVWATKRWTPEGFEDLARILLERGYEVELVGSQGEKALCDQIASHVKGVKNSAGQTSLTQLVSRFSAGKALVCNDSGAMHAAAAAGLPTVAVFGPTTLDLGFRPWNNHAVVVQKELKCRPCGKHGPQKCPLGTHECMQSISAKEVYAALEPLL